jgi:RNA polymerase sigma-70 factor (ECF subfamily)
VDFSSLEDRQLLHQIAHGEEAALAALFDRYGGLVYSVALRIIHDRQSAEEIVLDTFTKVWRSGQSYRPDRGNVSTWLTSIARNRAIDHLRRENVRPESVDLTWATIAPTAGSLSREPETTVGRRLVREKVRQALVQLPQEQQEVLALAYFGGFSQQEIADRLQQPLGTVKTRVRLAMQKLHFLLREI